MISYIQQLLRADAYDESCLERPIDATARDFLHISFAPTRVLQLNPTTNWMRDWDVATLIEALEESTSQ